MVSAEQIEDFSFNKFSEVFPYIFSWNKFIAMEYLLWKVMNMQCWQIITLFFPFCQILKTPRKIVRSWWLKIITFPHHLTVENI